VSASNVHCSKNRQPLANRGRPEMRESGIP
jgi:hypothetical protein